MTIESLEQHLQDEIASSTAQRDKAKIEKNKAVHATKLGYLESLLRYVQGKPTREDAILADVVNDLMQNRGALASRDNFRDMERLSLPGEKTAGA
ncbi:hypothetical protein [Pseudomonas sp. UBA6562]|uniref:hypothetical protein n=1 Tax=Pseudomonas sp. UBA6562 TaxID=1947332 RepID=UPI0025E6998A|nr:hypothetical protein [Pseudomonas sp. UBA6562]